MPTKEARAAMLEKYSSSLMDQGANSRQYTHMIAKYLEHVGYHELNRDNTQAYLDYLREYGYAPGTVKLFWSILHRFFIVNKLEWPFKNREAPRVPEQEKYAPALDPDLIREYIALARAGKLSQRTTAFLALSTIYGLRAIELREVRKADIDIKSKSILIHTAKHGRERWHKLPDEIVPYIENYDWPPVSYHWIRKSFFEIEEAAGQEHQEEIGFHSIRRTVDTELGLVCKELVVHRFLRWADTSMAQRYTAYHYIGREGVKHNVGGDDLSGDSIIFANHPFIKVWGGK